MVHCLLSVDEDSRPGSDLDAALTDRKRSGEGGRP